MPYPLDLKSDLTREAEDAEEQQPPPYSEKPAITATQPSGSSLAPSTPEDKGDATTIASSSQVVPPEDTLMLYTHAQMVSRATSDVASRIIKTHGKNNLWARVCGTAINISKTEEETSRLATNVVAKKKSLESISSGAAKDISKLPDGALSDYCIQQGVERIFTEAATKEGTDQTATAILVQIDQCGKWPRKRVQ